MYGSIVIENDIEASLKGTTLPTDDNTHSLVLSDIEFDASGNVGFAFDGATRTVNELVELCHLSVDGLGGNGGACGIPNAGDAVPVNGEAPDPAARSPSATRRRIRSTWRSPRSSGTTPTATRPGPAVRSRVGPPSRRARPRGCAGRAAACGSSPFRKADGYPPETTNRFAPARP
jgi:hypothetical protein